MKQSFSVVQAGVDPSILLPQPAKGWHYKHKPSGPTLKAVLKRIFLSHGWLTPLPEEVDTELISHWGACGLQIGHQLQCSVPHLFV